MSHVSDDDGRPATPRGQTTSDKTKVFVSYSRRDQERVSRLQELLEVEPEFTIFRDTDDILPAEEWKPRLEHLIRAADAILFALSPHSARSDVCQWEVELAESLNKRIVPVVIETTADDEVPAALAKLNYIYFTPDRDAAEAIGSIAAAVDTDIEWIREHTRLAELADRWARTRHRGGKPLLGRELAEAERWLANQPRHAPNPTEAHRTFIYESRRAAIRRTRWNSIAALIAAVIFAGLAAVSYLSYKDANDNFVLALLTRADRLLSEELPSKVLVVASAIDRRGWLAAGLEWMGLIVPDDDQSVRIRTLARLAGPTSARPVKEWKYSSAATAVAFDRTGSRFAIGYNNGEVHVRPVKGDGPGRRLVRNGSRVRDVEFGPDGRFLASASSTEVLLWDLVQGTARRFCETGSEITAMAFDPRGQYLAWTFRDGRLVVFDLQTEARTEFEEFETAGWTARFSPSGALFVSTSGGGTIAIRRTSDWTIVSKTRTDRRDLVGIAINPGETRLATASLAGPVDIWDLAPDGLSDHRVTLDIPADKRWKVRYSRDGRLLALSSWQGTVRLWDAGSLEYRGTIDGHDLRVNDITFSPAGPLLLSATESGIVRLWNLEGVHPMFLTSRGDAREPLVGQYSPDGTMFASGGKDGDAILFRVTDGGGLQKVCPVHHPNWVYSLSFSRDSRRVASVSLVTGRKKQAGSMKIWDAETCSVIRDLQKFSDSNIELVAHSPTGDIIAWAGSAGEIWLTDANGGNAVQLPHVHTADVGAIDFSGDGRYLVSGGLDARVIVWDVAKRAVFRELTGHNPGEYVWTVAFAPNRPVLASSGTEPRILVWDLSRPPGGELIRTLPLEGGANRLAFNSQGSVLAVGSGDRAISMWETAGWRKTFQLNTLVGIRSVFDFHPERGDLAFDGGDGLIRIYLNAPLNDLAALGDDVVLDGMDVFFDRGDVTVAPTADGQSIAAPAGGCR